MKKIICTTALAILCSSTTSFATSDNECSIWLCLPAGFPSGCSAAYSAMMSRLDDLKPPLPSFSGCAVKSDGGSTMTYDYSYAAYIPAITTCTKYRYTGGDSGERYCVESTTSEAGWVKGRTCIHQTGSENETWSPYGCTKTARYVDVYADGVLIGETYYW